MFFRVVGGLLACLEIYVDGVLLSRSFWFLCIVLVYGAFGISRYFVCFTVRAIVRVSRVNGATARSNYGILSGLSGCGGASAYRVFASIVSSAFCGYTYAEISCHGAFSNGASCGYFAAYDSMGDSVSSSGILV